jgi:hypothetical protein
VELFPVQSSFPVVFTYMVLAAETEVKQNRNAKLKSSKGMKVLIACLCMF